MGELSEKIIGHIKDLRPFLPDEEQEQLTKILAYGEKMKVEWKRKKKEFWRKHNREDFLKLLNYMLKHQKVMEWKYEYLAKMNEIERKKFIEEYLCDDILYSWELDETAIKVKEYSYEDWKEWNVVMEEWAYLCFYGKRFWLEWAKAIAENMKLKEWVILDLHDNQIWAEWAREIANHVKFEYGVSIDLSDNRIWPEWAKAISHMNLKDWALLHLWNNKIWAEWAKEIADNLKLEDGVSLFLWENGIWVEWAKAIAENMKLKEWVKLYLGGNEIWDKWAEAISHMELKEWVKLYLFDNKIWDEWAKAIMKNLKLQVWVVLNLRWNNISGEMKDELKQWAQSYNAVVDTWEF